MLTTSSAQSTLQTLTGVLSTDTTNTALLMQFWNDSRRTVGGIRGGNWPWRLFESTVLTVADQDYVYIPNDMERVTAVRTTVGTGSQVTIYLPKLIFDEQKWQYILALRLGSNQYPYFVFQRGQKLLMNPVSSVTDTPVILMGRRAIKDLNIADITNVTVTTATLGSTALTVSGSMTADMVGRYIRITQTSVANGGDGYWYEIGSFTNATTINLVKPYQGLSIVGGTAASTIGQITYEPEAWQMAPIYRATAQFWDFKENQQLSERYWMLYDGGQEIGKRDEPAGMIGQMLEEAGETFDGHYISPDRSSFDGGPNNPPYWYPWELGTGM